MLSKAGKWGTLFSLSPIPMLSLFPKPIRSYSTNHNTIVSFAINERRRALSICCSVRRRVRYDEEDDDDDGEDEYGYNQEIAMLEMYTQSARGEALLVRASVDEQEAEVLIFKGFSSSLSHGTSPDPSRSVLPARAVIKSIDRIKGPFDPSNIEYLERDLDLEAFLTRIPPNLST